MRICPQCQLQTPARQCPNDGTATVFQGVAATVSAVDPLIGSTFEGRYRIERLIGRGGFGAVYLGTQLTIGRPVAIKILRAELANSLSEVARFQQEARAMAAIAHPNVVVVYDFGQTSNRSLFLVTEFLDGEPLSALLKREAPLEPDRVARIALQVLDGLAMAHEANVVHRDLKPENLFIISRGHQRDVVKILDFGIAKVSGDHASSMTLTQHGQTLGSPRYMSPEQAQTLPVSPQSDLYSLGVILHEALTATPLFDSQSATGYLMAHIREEAPPLAVDGVALEGPLPALIMSCLEKDPARRPTSARTAAAALTTVAPQPTRRAPAPRPAAPPARRPLTVDDPITTGRHGHTSAVDGVTIVQPKRYAQQSVSNPLLWAIPLAVLMLVGVAGSAYWFVLRPGALLSPPETRASPAVTVPTTDGDESGTDELEIHLDGDTPTIEPAAAKDGEPTAEGAAPAVELWTSVESKPAGATVTRGEEVLGETPLSVAWIEGVATRVRIEREGYAPVTVSLGEDVVGGSLHVELVRERAGKKAPTAEATITRTSGR